MLQSLSEWIGRQVIAWDGPAGEIVDAWFDDLEWRLRYLVAAVDGERRLFPPAALTPAEEEGDYRVNVSREQISQSPPLPETTVTREYEAALHDHYGWEPYSLEMATDADDDEDSGASDHLRSLSTLRGRPILATDGPAGRLADLVVNDENWAIFYMVVEVAHLLSPDQQVILPPSWVTVIDDDGIAVDLGAEIIAKSRPYEPDRLNES